MLSAESLRVFTVPDAAIIVASLDLPHVIGAVSVAVSVNPLSTTVTPVTFFFILIDPFVHSPEKIYTPEPLIVSAVPSILYSPYLPSRTVIPESENTNAVASELSYSAAIAAGINVNTIANDRRVVKIFNNSFDFFIVNTLTFLNFTGTSVPVFLQIYFTVLTYRQPKGKTLFFMLC